MIYTELPSELVEIFNMETDEIFLPGRRDRKVKARSFLCFWAARELARNNKFKFKS